MPHGRKVGIMAKSKLTKRISVLALALVVSLFVTSVFAGGAFKAQAKDRSVYYRANKELVAPIDGDGYFAVLDEADNLTQMEAIVEVATAVKEFEKAYAEGDYLADDWKQIKKYFALCENACRVKGAEDDNYYLNYTASYRSVSEYCYFHNSS